MSDCLDCTCMSLTGVFLFWRIMFFSSYLFFWHMHLAFVCCCWRRGVINSVANKGNSTCPIVHCHTAVGHSKAVLSLFAVDELLITGSKGKSLVVINAAVCCSNVCLFHSHQNFVKTRWCWNVANSIVFRLTESTFCCSLRVRNGVSVLLTSCYFGPIRVMSSSYHLVLGLYWIHFSQIQPELDLAEFVGLKVSCH